MTIVRSQSAGSLPRSEGAVQDAAVGTRSQFVRSSFLALLIELATGTRGRRKRSGAGRPDRLRIRRAACEGTSGWRCEIWSTPGQGALSCKHHSTTLVGDTSDAQRWVQQQLIFFPADVTAANGTLRSSPQARNMRRRTWSRPMSRSLSARRIAAMTGGRSDFSEES